MPGRSTLKPGSIGITIRFAARRCDVKHNKRAVRPAHSALYCSTRSMNSCAHQGGTSCDRCEDFGSAVDQTIREETCCPAGEEGR
ncbi:hypothetical protein ACFFX0_20365 [Citricoccus parietis]|uniref:Uncharacterized protein n=1 Tax=Citricoccus parietis TaxID=592307 RepID=A0ABV5G3B8_9MICC